MSKTLNFKEGNYNDANNFKYGIKKLTDQLYTVKLRFTNELAEIIPHRLRNKVGFANMYITNASNKGCRMIYGTIHYSSVYHLQYAINIVKAERLERQAKVLREDLEPYAMQA